MRLYKSMWLVPMRCAFVMTVAFTATTGNADPPAPTLEDLGEWSMIDWGFNFHNAAVVPTGEVLVWRRPFWCDASSGDMLLDPVTETLTPAGIPSPLGNNCVAFSFLPTGSLLIAGGSGCSPLTQSMIFGHTNGVTSWSAGPSMHKPRWYPTATTLGDGRVLLSFGTTGGGSGTPQATPEVYDPETNTWTLLENAEHPDGTNPSNAKTYPAMFTLPNGNVFLAERLNGLFPQVLDLDSEEWTDVFDNNGSLPTCGQIRCSYVMHTPGRILRIDGTSDIRVIDFTKPAQQIDWVSVSGTQMVNSRRRYNSVLLPNGYVLAVAGHTSAGQSDPVKEAEWIDPRLFGTQAQEPWQELAEMNRGRTNLHNLAILLPDGRVLSASGHPDSENELTAEMFSPPYLFNGNQSADRPEIHCVPEIVPYSSTFGIVLDEESPIGVEDIGSVVLIGLGANTHLLDQNQRFVSLRIASRDVENNQLKVVSPVNGNFAPPGYYMLFVVSRKNVANMHEVPSVAKFVRLVVDCPDCSADLNQDGVVNAMDLLELLAQWGDCPQQGPCPADLNGDGTVGILDLLILLASWGPCTMCGECLPDTVEDCWQRFSDDIENFERCVEWVAEEGTLYPR